MKYWGRLPPPFVTRECVNACSCTSLLSHVYVHVVCECRREEMPLYRKSEWLDDPFPAEQNSMTLWFNWSSECFHYGRQNQSQAVERMYEFGQNESNPLSWIRVYVIREASVLKLLINWYEKYTDLCCKTVHLDWIISTICWFTFFSLKFKAELHRATFAFSSFYFFNLKDINSYEIKHFGHCRKFRVNVAC